MTYHKLITTILLTLAMMSPAGDIMAAEDVRVPENRVIYEVFVRNFSPEGNFKGVEAQIPRLKELGVDVVWLMPIYKLGDIGRWGTYSSPYAIKDYTAIDPDNGTADDLRSLVSTIHANGMEIWFDWVGNHTSRDNVWVSTHPEYYGNNFYSPNGWNDVYQLDVNNAAMHEAMIEAMQYWVDNFDIDGYRCDFASGPSEEFWRKATSRVLKNGERIAWLAEDDSRPELVSRGYFDYNYAWAFHDRLMEQARDINLNTLRNECSALHNESAYRGRSRMVYLSNHDVVQDKGGSEDHIFGRYLRPMTVLQFTVYGMPLIYNGQEIGYSTGPVSLAEKTPIDWNHADTSMTGLITTLTRLKHTQPALRTGSQNGSYTNLTTSDDNSIMAYRRSLGDNHVVVVLNFSDSQREFSIGGSLPTGTYTDVFSGREIDFSNSARFSLPPLGYAVFISSDGQNDDEHLTPATASICIANNTGWNPVYLYAWADNKAEIFGSWCGASPVGTRTVDGIEYQVFTTGATGTYNLIFNNGKNQLDDITLNIENGKNYYFAADRTGMVATAAGELPGIIPVTPSEPAPGNDACCNLYIRNKTSWKAVNAYAWADNMPELYGRWPGARPLGKRIVNHEEYLIYDLPRSSTPYSFIFSNNGSDSEKIDGPVLTPEGDTFVTLSAAGASVAQTPSAERHAIYVEDKTGWPDFYIYAWAEGEPEFFGSWPGTQASCTVNADGVNRLTFPFYSSDVSYNLIFTDGEAQYDATSITPDRDIDIVAGPHSIESQSWAGASDCCAMPSDTPAYYNMQGVRVTEPDGLCIEVRGNITGKIIR